MLQSNVVWCHRAMDCDLMAPYCTYWGTVEPHPARFTLVSGWAHLWGLEKLASLPWVVLWGSGRCSQHHSCSIDCISLVLPGNWAPRRVLETAEVSSVGTWPWSNCGVGAGVQETARAAADAWPCARGEHELGQLVGPRGFLAEGLGCCCLPQDSHSQWPPQSVKPLL